MSVGLTFNGVSSKLTTDLTSHSATVTYSVWIRPVTAGGANLGRVFDKRTVGAEVELIDYTGSNLEFNRSWNGGTSFPAWVTTAGTVLAGPWVAVGLSYDSGLTTNNGIWYLDGVSVAVTQLGADPTGSVDSNADPIVIGNRGSDNARGFDGDMASFAIWDRILTAAEHLSLFQGADPRSMATNLLRYYRMDQGGANEPDLAGIGANATATNLTTSGTSPPPFRGGPTAWLTA